jgi:hypothetical protein
MVGHQARCVIVALAREFAGGRVVSEPDARLARGNDRGSDAVAIHRLDALCGRPFHQGLLASFARNDLGDESSRRKMAMRVDPVRLSGRRLRRECEFRDQGCRAKRSKSLEKLTPWHSR